MAITERRPPSECAGAFEDVVVEEAIVDDGRGDPAWVEARATSDPTRRIFLRVNPSSPASRASNSSTGRALSEIVATYQASPAPHVLALREEVARRGWRVYDEREGEAGYRLWVTDGVNQVHLFVYVATVQVQDVNERREHRTPSSSFAASGAPDRACA